MATDDSNFENLEGGCAKTWKLWILLLALDDSSERVLLQQIFWSLGLCANPTWSPAKANGKYEEKKAP